jgi:alpha-L-fucosidase
MIYFNKMSARMAVILVLVSATILQTRAGYIPAPSEQLKWFTDARFGMFIHFGLYSIPAGVWEGEISGRNMYAEWIQKQGNWPHGIEDKEYQALTNQFNPANFNAEEWVLEAKNAGMKYMVITSKHHDGFALWPSEVSDFDVMDATPFKRDILGELADACEKHGLKLGFYYSHWQDWKHPGGAKPPADQFKSIPPPKQVSEQEFNNYWNEKCLPQVRELMENYKPAIMWFDTWGDPPIITDERVDELIALVREIDPECLINSRILMKRPGIEKKVDFISMGDNSFPTETIEQPWETSGTMNHSWGYHQLDYFWKPTGVLLESLAGNVSRNGNFQLNIGPKADGTFPKASTRRLREMGAWMFVNGEAVYATKPNPFRNVNWGYITWKEKKDRALVYLHVTEWTDNHEIAIPGFRYLPDKAYVLETGEPVQVFPHHTLHVNLPDVPVDKRITVIALELDKELFRQMIGL